MLNIGMEWVDFLGAGTYISSKMFIFSASLKHATKKKERAYQWRKNDPSHLHTQVTRNSFISGHHDVTQTIFFLDY